MRISTIVTTVFLVCLSLPVTVSADNKGVILVTGANRGLGLEFTKQLQEKGYEVIGTARSPGKAVQPHGGNPPWFQA